MPSPHTAAPGFVAIDFGTSNSAVALPAGAHGVSLVELEPGQLTMPTAVFYCADTPQHQLEADRLYGRAAVAAYVEGVDGRLMRSMKSILGSSLLDQSTDIGGGRHAKYRDVVTGYLRRLKTLAETHARQTLQRVVLGRPVFFVDDDPTRDAQAAAALEAAAREVGFLDVQFQFEPIAAALDHESHIDHEQLVLVADIGGGTSDFSLVRVGPERARRGRTRGERRDDILANHGVHLAGTDFDRHVELAAILPLLGYRTLRPARPGDAPREVPSGVYFDLATWHLINTVYAPARLAELRGMKSWYAEPRHHARLMTALTERLGHALAAAAEQAKIDVAVNGAAQIDLAALGRSRRNGSETDRRAPHRPPTSTGRGRGRAGCCRHRAGWPRPSDPSHSPPRWGRHTPLGSGCRCACRARRCRPRRCSRAPDAPAGTGRSS